MGPWYQQHHYPWTTGRWMLDEEEGVLLKHDDAKQRLNVLQYSQYQQEQPDNSAVPVQAVKMNVVKLIGHPPGLPLPRASKEHEEMYLWERIDCHPEHMRRMIGDVDIPKEKFEVPANS